MNLLFTVCARAGSKGVRNKNIRKLGDYPILYYTMSAYDLFCRKYGSEYPAIDFALNTDSPELVEQWRITEIPGDYIPRKNELAGDRVGKMEVIRDTLLSMEKLHNRQYDVIMDLDVTSPIRSVRDVKGILDLVVNDPCADISFSVTGARRSPWFNMVDRKKNGYYDKVVASNFVSRQEAPVCFDMNASIYAYHREYLLNFKERPARKSLIWEMEDTGILDIDSETDYELLSVIADYLFDKKNELSEIRAHIKDLI
ncbi:MAG: acylneuraminate cytidylyltransferase family protein [Lachnospiraceae bacterium]|nr:acylneuraminate cytidylyltransferase family protein [Lachnospiraceae bacterium]